MVDPLAHIVIVDNNERNIYNHENGNFLALLS